MEWYQFDFLDVETRKSGDAIALRYGNERMSAIHVVDGGFLDTGQKLCEHIDGFYGLPLFINHVVVTHQDSDHTKGLAAILEYFDVGTLWMIRPWQFAPYLINHFARFQSVANLSVHLRGLYPNLAELEDIANQKKIPILNPFQGQKIGVFTVLAPSAGRYANLILDSERTPAFSAPGSSSSLMTGGLRKSFSESVSKPSAWGYESFSNEPSSVENEISVVQCAQIAGMKIMLTGDAGKGALEEAIAYAPTANFPLPGIDLFQVPHHGSRRNVSSSILDALLVPPWTYMPTSDQTVFNAIISSAKEDLDHPRKAVVRAMIHRGGRVFSTEGRQVMFNMNAARQGWGDAPTMDYPTTQEI